MCFVHGQGQKSEQKPTTKSFDEFHNHSPLLTMYTLTLQWGTQVTVKTDEKKKQKRRDNASAVQAVMKTRDK